MRMGNPRGVGFFSNFLGPPPSSVFRRIKTPGSVVPNWERIFFCFSFLILKWVRAATRDGDSEKAERSFPAFQILSAGGGAGGNCPTTFVQGGPGHLIYVGVPPSCVFTKKKTKKNYAIFS